MPEDRHLGKWSIVLTLLVGGLALLFGPLLAQVIGWLAIAAALSLGLWWFVLPRWGMGRPRPPRGLQFDDARRFMEGDAHGFRVIMRPLAGWRFMVLKFRFHLDAPVMEWRMFMVLKPDQKIRIFPEETRAPFDWERIIETPTIPASVFHLAFSSHEAFAFEFLSPNEIAVTKVERIEIPPPFLS